MSDPNDIKQFEEPTQKNEDLYSCKGKLWNLKKPIDIGKFISMLYQNSSNKNVKSYIPEEMLRNLLFDINNGFTCWDLARKYFLNRLAASLIIRELYYLGDNNQTPLFIYTDKLVEVFQRQFPSKNKEIKIEGDGITLSNPAIIQQATPSSLEELLGMAGTIWGGDES